MRAARLLDAVSWKYAVGELALIVLGITSAGLVVVALEPVYRVTGATGFNMALTQWLT